MTFCVVYGIMYLHASRKMCKYVAKNNKGCYRMKRLSLKKLAEAVTSYRRAGGITQAEFAKKAGINRSVLSNIENGVHTPTVNQLETLAGILGCEPADFFFEEERK